MPRAVATTASASSALRAASTLALVTMEAPRRGTVCATSSPRTGKPAWPSCTASLLEKPTMASTLPVMRAETWV